MSFLALCLHVAASSVVEALVVAGIATVAVLVRAEWPTIRAALAGRHGRSNPRG